MWKKIPSYDRYAARLCPRCSKHGILRFELMDEANQVYYVAEKCAGDCGWREIYLPEYTHLIDKIDSVV